ncbi:MAG: pyruvate, phosphate dikinase [Myxococcota bacterium]|nr:pyruvate, phosphate dikinase [Myxococcota bacterium]
MSARKKSAARRKTTASSSSGSRKKASTKKKKAARKKATGQKARKKKARKKTASAAKSVAQTARRKATLRSKQAASRSSGAGETSRVVFYFGDGQADGRAELRDTLGGKGANLAEMTNLGVPVPPGFTISTAVCSEYNSRGRRLSKSVRADVLTALARVEQSRGRRFGDVDRPLLVSVRSGARVSMPGMMDTVLNLGLNHETVEGLAVLADERFAFDSYRRFIQMYGDVVLGVPHERFEHLLETRKLRLGVDLDTELEGNDLRGLVREYLEIVEEHTGQPFPQNPEQQLWGAISAVFDSWQNERAVAYRGLHGIDEAWGTAVNVQSMVFGNMGEQCATGVAFTRNPSTGDAVFYGEYLMNAQGEDVVAGIRTPQPINESSRTADTEGLATLEEQMPKAYRELVRIQKRLERHYRDMQDIEFTIEEDKLWMLQTRSGKRTTAAAVRIAVDMANERLIKREEAIARVQPSSLDQLLHPTLDRSEPLAVIARGLPASPGAAVGQVVFSAEEAETRSKAGERVVLVRIETSPEDILGMHAAQGILTAKGGMTSHAAVVARGMGKCCVAGCGSLAIDYAANEMRVGEHVIRAGDSITVDGSTGDVILGTVPTVIPELGVAFEELMTWADRFRKLRVRTNADTPQDAEMARRFGAEGIGLCRTEHMFFQPERLLVVQEMILARDAVTREGALSKLLPMQRQDFEGIFRAMAGLPVTVRLLDPPLHEFLPKTNEEIQHVAEHTGSEVGEVRAKVDSLHEWNPMLGHRGCRVGITFPEIYRMQVRAITEAACVVASEGVKVKPEIMVPLVAHPMELLLLRSEIETEIAAVRSERPRCRVKPEIGTMIEVPRAALTADVIAEYADFFSFGTNDLTQMGYALSRDDAGGFLADYVERGIMADDPFVSIDEQGIGELVRLGAEKGRSTRPRLKLGICGEHGGDPQSIQFFAGLGFDYVSCSPYRVPVARLAAAQAVVAGLPG